MRATTALVVVALGCGGCALDATETGDDDPEIGEAEEAATIPTIHLKFPRTYSSKVFQVGNGATIAAAIRTQWDRPSDCKRPTITVSLTKVNMLLDDTIGQVPHLMNAKTVKYSWPALKAGRYRIDLGSVNTNPYCFVVGTMDVNVTP